MHAVLVKVLLDLAESHSQNKSPRSIPVVWLRCVQFIILPHVFSGRVKTSSRSFRVFLHQNSEDNQLSATQLSLAYAALVRSAGAFGRNTENVTTHSETQARSGDAFAWYCLQTLIDLIRSISSQRPSSDYLHRLHLTLIATLPSVSLVLLPRLLEVIHTIVLENATPERKGELVDTMFKEILENIGDQEKEFAMRWWYDHRDALGTEYKSSTTRDFANNLGARSASTREQAGTSTTPDLVSRL